ncbi:MAG: YraN family protein [Alphaproteobacteria bacterium]
MSRKRRRKAFRRGLWAETLCVILLRLRGYRILARRLRSPVGEIDILARRGRTLAIVEVKARANIRQAAESISLSQRRRLVRATEWAISGRPDLSALDIRFDVVFVLPWRLPVHVVDAWRADEV